MKKIDINKVVTSEMAGRLGPGHAYIHAVHALAASAR